MSAYSIKQAIQRTLSEYKDALDAIPEDDFQKKPPGGGWSLSELYSHLIQVNRLALISIEKCINGTAKKNSRYTHWKVWLIMLFGKLPPGRIQAPQRIAEMVSLISREEARNQLIMFGERFNEVWQNIPKASPHLKVSHPVLGPLNARQWLRFIDIHTRHHKPQFHRISLAVSS